MNKKMCLLCGHEELYPNEFVVSNNLVSFLKCPLCKAQEEFIKDVEIVDEDDEDLEIWQKQ